MKRFFGFIGMFLLSIPDLVLWVIPNLVLGLTLFLVGMIARMPLLKRYGYNIMFAVDQFIGTKAMGQDPDVTISMALGVALQKHESKKGKVALFWIYFAKFVNFLFAVQVNHVEEAIEKEESAKYTVFHLYRPIKQKDEENKKAA